MTLYAYLLFCAYNIFISFITMKKIKYTNKMLEK